MVDAAIVRVAVCAGVVGAAVVQVCVHSSAPVACGVERSVLHFRVGLPAALDCRRVVDLDRRVVDLRRV